MNEQKTAELVRQLAERLATLESRLAVVLDTLPDSDPQLKSVVAALLALDETACHLAAEVKGIKIPPSMPQTLEEGGDGITVLET